MELEIIMLSEINQTQKYKHQLFSLICEIYIFFSKERHENKSLFGKIKLICRKERKQG
jgi:hypothetical protein